MRLVLWCANGREYFFCRFSLMSVEMNGLSDNDMWLYNNIII